MQTMLASLRLCLFWLAISVAAFAQQAETPDYVAWDKAASRVERAVEGARASDTALEENRAEIVEFRGQFQAQLNANATRLETIQSQIAALGDPPAEGETEPDEIAERRAELNEQLARLTTPRKAAEEAFNRANGIISEIDTILRQRQAEALLNAGPTPLNPTYWPGALKDLTESAVLIVAGVRSAAQNPGKISQLQNNLPLILFLTLLGLALLARGRKLTERLSVRISKRSTRAIDQLASLVVSLGQILFPVLGFLSLLVALRMTELFGPRGQTVLDTALVMTAVVSSASWLGGRIFPKSETAYAPVGCPIEKRRRGRYLVTVLGTLTSIFLLFDALGEFERYSVETLSVLDFPISVVLGLTLIGLGRFLRQHDPEVIQATNPTAFRHQAIRILGRAAIIVGFVGPVLAAAGYTAAAETLIFPAILTLALIAAVTIVQEVIRNLYALIVPGEDSRDSLVPTLLGFLLLLSSTPLFALIWGARVTDLAELWRQLGSGISIGETRISPGAFFTLLIVFIIGYLLTRALQASLRTTILPKTQIDPGGQTALVAGVGYVGIFLAAVTAISIAGLDLSSIAIVAGALSVGIGFGLQNIVSNFVSGIILLIERPISEGDWIEVGGHMGYVRKVSVRSTRIETFDRSDVIVPNSDFVSGAVTNYTRGNTVGRAIVQVGVAYGTDTRMVETILREIAEDHPMVLANPKPSIVFAGFGASSLDFEIRAILRDVNFMLSVKTEIHHQIAERFVKEGIEIPFPQNDLWLRNPEALRAAPKDETPPETA